MVLILTLLNPTLALSGIFSVLSAYLFARFLGYQKEFLASGYYTYNALLVGLSIGQLFSFSPLSALYLAISASITFLITVSFADVFNRLFTLPILSIPFVIVSSLIYLSASGFSNLYVNELYAAGHIELLSDVFPLWINGLLKSLGAIIFMPDPLVGLLLLTMILINSRIIFLLIIAGYYFGTFLQGTFTGSYTAAYSDLNAFNYLLIAVALGAIFNIPNIKSYGIAMIGVAAASVLIESIDVFWSQYNIPVFTLPFTIITLVSIYVLGLLNYPLRPRVFKETPEETTQYFHIQKLRYPETMPFVLPFLDNWTVYQGFDGKWTHQGIWKYAYDFVKTDVLRKTYQGDGKHLTDYYCFQQPVSAPCKGYVAYVADCFPDNPIGTVDNINNWGNYVIIQDIRGYYVGICHLAQHSVTVKPGDWVEPYQVIGACGNSGYSPEPHIHMQYQTTSMMTSVTIPFCFTGVIEHNQYFNHHLPDDDVEVHPNFPHAFYLQTCNFVLDDVFSFQVYKNDKLIENIAFKTSMALDGSFYLGRDDSRLYLGKTDQTFFCYTLVGNDTYLKMLYQALPSMPLNYIKNGHWNDVIPTSFFAPKFNLQTLVNFSHYFMPSPLNCNARYQFESDTEITGTIQVDKKYTIHTYIKLDAYVKIHSFKVDDYHFIATIPEIKKS